MYNKKVMSHFLHPHNMGEIKNADGIGKAGNIVCGDVMQIFLKIEKDTIKDIKFRTLGCAAAIATSSVATDLAKGKKINQALKIKDEDIIKKLGDLPSIKLHCSLLSVKALREAIYNYLSKNKLPIPKELESVHKKNKKELSIAKKKHGKE